MFSTTLTSSWDERSRRSLMTLASFILQVLAVAVLIVIPLLRPTGLPLLRQLSAPVSLGQPGNPPVAQTQMGSNPTSQNSSAIILRPPPQLPSRMPAAGDEAALPFAGPGPSGPYIPGTGTLGSQDGVFSSWGTGVRPVMPVAPRVVTPPLRISHMNEGNLIHKVVPTYPPLARMARIQGQVVLQAVISKQGVIENLRVLSGHPMLAPAAMEAVRQWRYRPYVLNNEPVEVETQITVNFSLAEN